MENVEKRLDGGSILELNCHFKRKKNTARYQDSLGQDPILSGIVGSVYISSGILSVLELRSPLKFVPILLLPLCYKPIWFMGVLIPHIVNNELPLYGIIFAAIFATYIIGNLIAIPFPYVFAKSSDH